MNFPVSLKAVFLPDKGGKGGFRKAVFPDFSNQTGIIREAAELALAPENRVLWRKKMMDRLNLTEQEKPSALRRRPIPRRPSAELF